MYHIVGQASHAWNLLVKLTGNLEQDYKAVQPLIQEAIRTGKGEQVIQSGQKLWTYIAEVGGQIIEVHAREVGEALEIVDAFVRTQ
jgi:hypothetical protein